MTSPAPWLSQQRTVRFGDTDAAGVMHFHQLLRWCHEAYEQSLEQFGIQATALFPSPNGGVAVALPIIHCSADFLRPLACGDKLSVQLTPLPLDSGRFEVAYVFRRSTDDSQEVARGLTRHLAIDTSSRRRCLLPPAIDQWLQGSTAKAQAEVKMA
ncbi:MULTISPECIES: thioesterase family protein [Synechococcaceae]|uniref:acyl-CoA thioesterase n=1 Tax=Synechococcaceae TaxID=1890426 RepID=UPI0008FF2E26|nr:MULTISPECIES: acyl-CoA thioesterase [Synechococcaceae]APD47683.1 1,4-dihydroxy-2-naphthoyl-CoA hydrolase [Synechococcus sp. SynAce01]MCT4364060.1 acyl-CoA thioesterase [Candidatus Regnicoccus frigidus MAG-AL1]MCT4366365.1 acyl-CoA thioesterase [Candidatus Regnicoccus frigidus MAG-AL2]TWB87057.1 1,4-dihydroxy-2-naphthoyl-CoA hydrolase [Synechococcus sp. Ace-Pa]